MSKGGLCWQLNTLCLQSPSALPSLVFPDPGNGHPRQTQARATFWGHFLEGNAKASAESLCLYDNDQLRQGYEAMASRMTSKQVSFHDFISDPLLLKAGYSLITFIRVDDKVENDEIMSAIRVKLLPQHNEFAEFILCDQGKLFFSQVVRGRLSASVSLLRCFVCGGGFSDVLPPRLRFSHTYSVPTPKGLDLSGPIVLSDRVSIASANCESVDKPMCGNIGGFPPALLSEGRCK